MPNRSVTFGTDLPNNDNGPPGYSEAPGTSSAPAPVFACRGPVSTTLGLPRVDITKYLIPGAILSKDETTVTIAHKHLCSNPDTLLQFLTTQAALPPRPLVRIRGEHDAYTYGEVKVDFDIRLDLTRYLIREPDARPPLNYVKLVEPDEVAFRGDTAKSTLPHAPGGLGEWVHMFCQNPSANKAFILERELPNWNTPFLENCIRNLLNSLRYKGRVIVSFPVTHTHVVIKSPSQSGGSGLVPLLKSIMSDTRRYAVMRAVWPYANMMEHGGGAARDCAVMSEKEWWDIWAELIADAVMEKRTGWVSAEDLTEKVMVQKGRPKRIKGWGDHTY